jgi:hypothetical protein
MNLSTLTQAARRRRQAEEDACVAEQAALAKTHSRR